MSDGMNNIGSGITNTNNGYTATRTTTAGATNLNTMNFSVWTWIILAVAAVIIVSLVWYYASQNNTESIVINIVPE